MNIGGVARQAGLATSAIRFYEKAGLLTAPNRVNGRRSFQMEVLHELVIIRFAKDTGFTLPEIKLLLHGFPAKTPASARWKKMARGKIAEMETTIANAQAMKAMLERVTGCRCQKLAQCAEGMARHAEQRRKILARTNYPKKQGVRGAGPRP